MQIFGGSDPVTIFRVALGGAGLVGLGRRNRTRSHGSDPYHSEFLFSLNISLLFWIGRSRCTMQHYTSDHAVFSFRLLAIRFSIPTRSPRSATAGAPAVEENDDPSASASGCLQVTVLLISHQQEIALDCFTFGVSTSFKNQNVYLVQTHRRPLAAGTAQSGRFEAVGALWAVAAGVDRRGRAQHVSKGRCRDERHSNLAPIFRALNFVSYGCIHIPNLKSGAEGPDSQSL